MNILSETLNTVHLGEAVSCRNLAMFPVLGAENARIRYLTLDEALAHGAFRVTETSRDGSVPELRVENGGDEAVLLLDGEELAGAKQNRILNLTILVPPRSTVKVPVCCVEAGRWHDVSDSFGATDRTAYASLRARKLRDVSRSLYSASERRADQHGVWEDVAAEMARYDVSSKTGAMSDIFEARRAALEEYLSAFATTAGQLGMLFVIGGEVAGLDLFDRAATAAKQLPKLVRGYALDALGRGGSAAPDRDVAFQFMAALTTARTRAWPAVGMGHDVRFSGEGCDGAALAVDGGVIHLCAFAREVARSRARRSSFAGQDADP